MAAIGIDIGSTAAKAAVVEDGKLVLTLVEPTGFNSVDAANRLAAKLADAGYDVGECEVVATGYGRVSVPFANKTITEITCHGRGAAFLGAWQAARASPLGRSLLRNLRHIGRVPCA